MGGASPINLEGMKDADLLIGVPIYNNAATLGGVVEAIGKGVTQFFPQARAVLVCSDGGSTDGSEEIFRKTLSPICRWFLQPTPSRPFIKSISPITASPEKKTL